jgi:starch-binding outer membrane protein, SusD/RagB family
MTSTTRALAATAFAAALFVGGCDAFDATDLNNPGLDELQNFPTPTGVNTAATGLLIGLRTSWGVQNGFIPLLAILGREGYNLDPADPRFVSEMLGGPLNGGSPAFGGNLWGQRYANIRTGNTVLAAVEKVVGLSDAQKEGIRGFAKTIQALDLLWVIDTRDANGAVIDADIPPTAPPAEVVTRAETFDRIVDLLEEGRTHLLNAGPTFSFPLSIGFEGFDTPVTFIQFNRAIRARVAVYLNDWAGALTALSGSFLDTGAPLSLGAYHVFSAGAGDILNNLFDPEGRALNAHPSLRTDAQLRAGGGRDLRFEAKVKPRTEPVTTQGITTDILFSVYNSPTDPVPIIRNEELILLRAEANLGLNNIALALQDLNFIRVNSGGLPAYAGAQTAAAVLDALLYEKRYSLLFEGHRWIDLRHYGKLGTLPKDLPAHKIFSKFPLPRSECIIRATPPAGCALEVGN